MTPAKKYRNRGVVQQIAATATITSSGHVDETLDANWEPYCERWFAFEERTVTESLTGGQLNARATRYVEMRYDQQTKLIDTKMRLRMGDRTFNIAAPPVDIEERHRAVMFPVAEVV